MTTHFSNEDHARDGFPVVPVADLYAALRQGMRQASRGETYTCDVTVMVTGAPLRISVLFGLDGDEIVFQLRVHVPDLGPAGSPESTYEETVRYPNYVGITFSVEQFNALMHLWMGCWLAAGSMLTMLHDNWETDTEPLPDPSLGWEQHRNN